AAKPRCSASAASIQRGRFHPTSAAFVQIDRVRRRVVALRALSTGSGKARRLVLSAAAKVNLVLEILGRRDDGYHEIATVMQTVDLTDRLVIEDSLDLELRADSADVP